MLKEDRLVVSAPDFYLASTDSEILKEPRRCWQIKRVTAGHRDDLLMARIDPPIPPLKYSADLSINLVLLATRHRGASLFPINEWPTYVHVARPLIDNPESRNRFLEGEFTSILWGELYRTEHDARTNAM